MSAMDLALIVIGTIAIVAVINLAIWMPLLRRARRGPERLRAELAPGERFVLGPEPGIYRGSTSPRYSGIAGNATIALTNRRLAIRRLLGGPIDVPVDDLVGVREAKVFRSAARLGQDHLIARLRDGGEIGLYVPDHAAWLRALSRDGGQDRE